MPKTPVQADVSATSSCRTECFLFAGPTLYGRQGKALPLPPEVSLLPPVRRGDVAALVESNPPGTMALVDGGFHHCLAVGHEEIRTAVRVGWQVWGLSSMGAIRACEMRDLGVRGFGEVYEMFLRDPDFADDEVALLHDPEPPYTPACEPLVHLRAALNDLQKADLLSATAHLEILTHLKSLWYGDHTLPLFRRLLMERITPLSQTVVLERLNAFDRYRIKTSDLDRFLTTSAWRC